MIAAFCYVSLKSLFLEQPLASDLQASEQSNGKAQDDHVQAPSPPPEEPTQEQEKVKLKATVSLVPRTDKHARKGWLALASNPLDPNAWSKKWFVLKRSVNV